MAYSIGQKVSLGTLKVKGTYREKPNKPWQINSNGGNLIDYGGSSEVAISVENTQNGKALDWIYVEHNGKKLLICDRCLVANISWSVLNAAGLIFGKEITIDGKKYKARSLTGGINNEDKNNEWSVIIELNRYGIGSDNGKWNWQNVYTWCQDTMAGTSNNRTLRGYSSAAICHSNNHAYYYAYCGFRPVLEILNAAPLISDTDKNLGDFSTPLSKTYSVTDDNTNGFKLEEKLDNEVIRTMHNQTNGSFTLNLSERWQSLSNGTHTIKIVATDSEGEMSTRTFTFKKTNTPPKKPVVDYPRNNMRTGRNFDVIFRPQTDYENNAQNFEVEIASNDSFTADVKRFNVLKKKVGGGWQNADNFNNADENTQFKISVSLNDDTGKYVRVSTTDPSGSNIKNYSDIVKISTVNVLKIQTNPLEVEYLPKSAIVNMACAIDENATIIVELSNNATDAHPVWENATDSFQNQTYHVFTNTQKTSDQFAVAARITVNANDAMGEISISSVGVGVM